MNTNSFLFFFFTAEYSIVWMDRSSWSPPSFENYEVSCWKYQFTGCVDITFQLTWEFFFPGTRAWTQGLTLAR
jgi:hypothetical protein